MILPREKKGVFLIFAKHIIPSLTLLIILNSLTSALWVNIFLVLLLFYFILSVILICKPILQLDEKQIVFYTDSPLKPLLFNIENIQKLIINDEWLEIKVKNKDVAIKIYHGYKKFEIEQLIDLESNVNEL